MEILDAVQLVVKVVEKAHAKGVPVPRPADDATPEEVYDLYVKFLNDAQVGELVDPPA